MIHAIANQSKNATEEERQRPIFRYCGSDRRRGRCIIRSRDISTVSHNTSPSRVSSAGSAWTAVSIEFSFSRLVIYVSCGLSWTAGIGVRITVGTVGSVFMGARQFSEYLFRQTVLSAQFGS